MSKLCYSKNIMWGDINQIRKFKKSDLRTPKKVSFFIHIKYISCNWQDMIL